MDAIQRVKVPKISEKDRKEVFGGSALTDADVLSGKDLSLLFSKMPLTTTSTENLVEDPTPKSQLTEQDLIDIKKTRDNPKLTAMVKHIDALVDKTQKSRKELEAMMMLSGELKDQCLIQEKECVVLDAEQHKILEEMSDLRSRVDTLASEKRLMEYKLEELRLENNELEAFLNQPDVQAISKEVGYFNAYRIRWSRSDKFDSSRK